MAIYSRTQLLERHSRRSIDKLVQCGELRRAGRWCATRDEPDALVLTLQAGCRPTCITAARHHGLWTPSSSRIHVYGPRRASLRGGLVLHGWQKRWPETDPVASPRLLLEHAARCLDPVDVGILADSAMHQGRITAADVAAVARCSPRPVARILARTDGRAESGTESRARLFFALRGVPVQPQVVIDGVGRVDLLVGRSWVIECDSREHHTEQESYRRDRERDTGARLLGYLTTRLTYEMVETAWPTTRSQLLAILRTGEHMREPTRRSRPRRLR